MYEQITSSTNVLMCYFSVIVSLGIKMLLFCCYILNMINKISYIEQNSDSFDFSFVSYGTRKNEKTIQLLYD